MKNFLPGLKTYLSGTGSILAALAAWYTDTLEPEAVALVASGSVLAMSLRAAFANAVDKLKEVAYDMRELRRRSWTSE